MGFIDFMVGVFSVVLGFTCLLCFAYFVGYIAEKMGITK